MSKQLFETANQSLVGGVNSPVRAYKSVDSTPLFVKSGKGAYIQTEDNQELVDYVMSYGPLILGHAHEDILAVLQATMAKGTTFGAPTELETKSAEKIKQFYPYVDKVRFVSSGTEAAMSVIRLARGATNKDIIVKFRGCYHGHADPLLVAAGSGGLSLGVPDSKGVLSTVAGNTLVLEYNNVDDVVECFQKHGNKIAAIMLEPVCGNMGVILPDLKFVKTIRENCDKYGAMMVFDEVMCGFRSQRTGTHEWIGVEPDVVILGKVIGGGLPCGAYAAKKEVMANIAPEGPVYQAGTLSGNPLAMAAGLKTLELLEDGSAFKTVDNYTTTLCKELKNIAHKQSVPVTINQIGSMFSVFFTDNKVNTFSDVETCNLAMFTTFFHNMLEHNIFLPPSQFEACFTSIKHQNEHLEKTIFAFDNALSKLNV